MPITDKTKYDSIINKLFSDHKNIDGILTTNNVSAVTALKIAQQKGHQVPKDISIIGFTDGLISEYSSPSITTIAQHGYTMGMQAVELLIEPRNLRISFSVSLSFVIPKSSFSIMRLPQAKS